MGLGTAGFSGDGGTSPGARLSSPTGVAIGPGWKLYIADTGNHRVREVDLPTLVIRTVAGDGTAGYAGDGGAATSARLRSPVSVAVDSAGNLYVADQGNHALRLVEPRLGLISTVAGNGTAGYSGDGGPPSAARLDTLSGVAVDSSGRVYLADTLNNRVRRIAP